MDEIKVDKDEFLSLVYLLAENHFNHCGIEADLVSDDDHDSHMPHVAFYIKKTGVLSRTSSIVADMCNVLKGGVSSYMINKFHLEKSTTMYDAIDINKDNFELLKMLVVLTKEEMELWIKMR